MIMLCTIVLVIILLTLLLESTGVLIDVLVFYVLARLILVIGGGLAYLQLLCLNIMKLYNTLTFRGKFCLLLRRCISGKEYSNKDNLRYIFHVMENEVIQGKKVTRLFGIYLCNVLTYNQL